MNRDGVHSAGTLWKNTIRSDEVVGISMRNTFKAILMLRFGLPEISHRRHLFHYPVVPTSRSVHDGNRFFGNLLLIRSVEDSQSVAYPNIVPLPIRGRGIVDLEEEL